MSLQALPLSEEQLTARKLRAIADVIEVEPHRWTQHAIARDTLGNPVTVISSDAMCWCTSGWILRTGIRAAGRNATVKAFRTAMGGAFNIPIWNDAAKRTAGDVVTMFRATATILESIK